MNTGVDGNKLVQVLNIARHFYRSSFRHVVKSTLEGTVLGVRYKNRISEGARLNVTHINGTLTIF